MAKKKVRRAKRTKQPNATIVDPTTISSEPAEEPTPKLTVAPSRGRYKQKRPKVYEPPTKEELEAEYSYVIKDLRRVFILAIALFCF